MYRRRDRFGRRTGPWYISIGGRRISSGTLHKERARRKEQKENAELWDKNNGFAVLTWEDACNSWIEANPGPWKMYHNQKYMAWWKRRLAGKRLPDIGRALIHSIISKELGADPSTRVPANATANGYVSFVSRIIRHGSNLRPDLIHYPRIRFRERWLKPEEWLKLLPHVEEDARDVFTYLLATGQREANAIFMEWPWIQGAAVFIPADRTKTKEPYGFPLNRTAQAIIEKRRQASVRHLSYVFSRQGKPWYRALLVNKLHDACQKAGIEDLTVHGLRHTFITWLALNGVQKELRMRLTGHQGAEVHDGYTHFDVEGLRAHCEVIDRVIAAAVSSQVTEQAVS